MTFYAKTNEMSPLCPEPIEDVYQLLEPPILSAKDLTPTGAGARQTHEDRALTAPHATDGVRSGVVAGHWLCVGPGDQRQ